MHSGGVSIGLKLALMLCYVVGSRRLIPTDALQPKAYYTNPGRSYLHHQMSPPETLVVKGGTTWARNGCDCIHFRVLLHSANMRHGTNGFTSRRLRPGLNPRTWVPKASTLLLDHRSPLKFALMEWNNYLMVVFRRRVYISLGSRFHFWSYFYKLNQTRRTSVCVGLSVLPVVECVARCILFVCV